MLKINSSFTFIIYFHIKYYNDFEAREYWPDWGQDDCQILYLGFLLSLDRHAKIS